MASGLREMPFVPSIYFTVDDFDVFTNDRHRASPPTPFSLSLNLSLSPSLFLSLSLSPSLPLSPSHKPCASEPAHASAHRPLTRRAPGRRENCDEDGNLDEEWFTVRCPFPL